MVLSVGSSQETASSVMEGAESAGSFVELLFSPRLKISIEQLCVLSAFVTQKLCLFC